MSARTAIWAGAALVWLHGSVARACAVCFSEEAAGDGIRPAILLLLGVVFAVQIVLARFLWRLLRSRDDTSIDAARSPSSSKARVGDDDACDRWSTV